ncbi:hypothetical protein DFAR_2080005 [Desulfarculales bacterium]
MSTRVPVSSQNLELVHQGLAAVVMEPGGTASVTRLPGISVAGKTGTSQVVALKHEKLYGHEGNLPWKYRNHALFVCYAPAKDPTIAVAVVVEHGGHGGGDAAPVARRVLESFFDLPVKERHKTRPGPLAGRVDLAEAAAGQKKAPVPASAPVDKKPRAKKSEQKKSEASKPPTKKPEAKKPAPQQPEPLAASRFAPKPFVPNASDPATNPQTYQGRRP